MSTPNGPLAALGLTVAQIENGRALGLSRHGSFHEQGDPNLDPKYYDPCHGGPRTKKKDRI